MGPTSNKYHMEFQCHPGLSRAKTEDDLQAEQDEFLLSGSISSTKLISNEDENNVKKVVKPSVPVLQEVVERDGTFTIKPPVMKAPLKPFKLTRKAFGYICVWTI